MINTDAVLIDEIVIKTDTAATINEDATDANSTAINAAMIEVITSAPSDVDITDTAAIAGAATNADTADHSVDVAKSRSNTSDDTHTEQTVNDSSKYALQYCRPINTTHEPAFTHGSAVCALDDTEGCIQRGDEQELYRCCDQETPSVAMLNVDIADITGIYVKTNTASNIADDNEALQAKIQLRSKTSGNRCIGGRSICNVSNMICMQWMYTCSVLERFIRESSFILGDQINPRIKSNSVTIGEGVEDHKLRLENYTVRSGTCTVG